MDRIVNIHHKKPYDVYIGRSKNGGMHYGNPFTHLDVKDTIKVGSRSDAVMAFKRWLSGSDHNEVEPARRQWILENIPSLKGKTLGCFCFPQLCHGDILALLAEGTHE